MKTAVETVFIGKDRLYNRRFLQVCGHYLVDPFASTPALAQVRAIPRKAAPVAGAGSTNVPRETYRWRSKWTIFSRVPHQLRTRQRTISGPGKNSARTNPAPVPEMSSSLPCRTGLLSSGSPEVRCRRLTRPSVDIVDCR